MTTPMRTVYAQSSDIRSRSWLEYRRDMKKKAIAELEFLPYLQRLLANRHGDGALLVRKHGGDAQLWFDASGRGVNQDPDYLAYWGDGETRLYEFQLAEETAGLRFFDFKEAKVGKKQRGLPRAPYTDRDFFYIIKDAMQYAFIAPEWIARNGRISGVPAWGNRTAYRVPRDVFLPVFVNGGAELERVVQVVDDKNYLLEFQSEFMEQEARRLSRELQQVVDEERLLSIVPRTLEGFYRVCFLLDRIGKQPDAPGVWLVYLMSFFNDAMSAVELARYIYALDFLYFKCRSVQENERIALENAITQAMAYIERRFATAGEGMLTTSPNEAPIDAMRQIIFAINLLEDIRQDAAVNFGAATPQVRTIFDTIPDVPLVAAYIRNASDAG